MLHLFIRFRRPHQDIHRCASLHSSACFFVIGDYVKVPKHTNYCKQSTHYNFWQAISVFMFQGECTVNFNNLFSKPSTPILTWTNPRQSFLGNYDYASHFTSDNSSVSVRFHFLVCCSITFRCIVGDGGNMLFIQVKGTHG